GSPGAPGMSRAHFFASAAAMRDCSARAAGVISPKRSREARMRARGSAFSPRRERLRARAGAPAARKARAAGRAAIPRATTRKTRIDLTRPSILLDLAAPKRAQREGEGTLLIRTYIEV